MHGRSAAVDQRAEVARQPVGQHRHHPVGKVGRVAAPPRLAVERRARPHVVRDVGDRHPDDVAARVRRIVVGLGEDRVVVVAGVGRVDGDEAAAPRRSSRWPSATGFAAAASASASSGKSSGMPCSWIAISDTDLRRRGVAEPGDDPRPRQAVAAGRRRVCSASTSSPSRAPAAVAAARPASRGRCACRSRRSGRRSRPRGRCRSPAAAPCRCGGSPARPAARRPRRAAASARAGGRRRRAPGRRGGCGPGCAAPAPSPSHSAGSAQRSPSRVRAGDPQHQHRRQLALRPHAGGGASSSVPRASSRARSCFSSTLAAPFSPKARAISRLAGLAGVVAQPGQDLVGGGKAAHGLPYHAADGRHRRIRRRNRARQAGAARFARAGAFGRRLSSPPAFSLPVSWRPASSPPGPWRRSARAPARASPPRGRFPSVGSR